MSHEGYGSMQPANIKVVGVGGGGSNAVNRMVVGDSTGVEYISVNTDKKSICQSKAHKVLQIGEKTTQGLGAGARPELGEKAALESEKQLREALAGADMVFVAAGMGGGTGTGAAPVVARISKEMGILTVGMVTKPFSFEGAVRMQNAVEGIEKLKQHTDSLVVILNSNLFSQSNKRMSILDAFGLADNILKTGIRSITETIYVQGLVSLDFADVRTIMKDKGLAHMGIGTGKGSDKAVEAALKAVNSPLLETDIQGATSLLINITGCEDMGIFEVEKAMEEIRKHIDKDAEIILGAALSPELDDEMCVTLVATGVKSTIAVGKGDAARSGILTSNRMNPASARNAASSESTRRVWAGSFAPNRTSPIPDKYDINLEIPSFIRNRSKLTEQIKVNW